MTLHIPYNEIELRIALMSLESMEEEKINELVSKVNKTITEQYGDAAENKAQVNKTVAKLNGITVKDLIDSPNYEKLIQEFRNSVITSIVDSLVNEGLEQKQAWALIALGCDLI